MQNNDYEMYVCLFFHKIIKMLLIKGLYIAATQSLTTAGFLRFNIFVLQLYLVPIYIKTSLCNNELFSLVNI